MGKFSNEEIFKKGWRQLSFISKEDVETHIETEDEADYYLVISQSCDILQYKYEAEPYVVLLGVKVIRKPDGNFVSLKNPRKLHIEAMFDGEQVFVELNFALKRLLDRTVLMDLAPKPEAVIDKDKENIVIRWLGNRYTRKAFPNEFERRLTRDGKKAIGEKLGECSSDVAAFLIKYTPEDCELSDDLSEDYEIIFQLLMSAEKYNNSDTRLKAEDCAEEIAEILEGVEGFSIINHRDGEQAIEFIESESIMTIEQYRQYSIFDFDYVTNSEEHIEPVEQ